MVFCQLQPGVNITPTVAEPAPMQQVQVQQDNVVQFDIKTICQRILNEIQAPGRLPWSMDGETKATTTVKQSVSGPFRRDIIIFVANNTTVDLKVHIAGMSEGHYLLYPAGTKIPKNVATSDIKTSLQLEVTPSGIDALGTYHIEVV